MTVIMLGNPMHGEMPQFYGPFDDFEHANQWIAINAPNQAAYVYPLKDYESDESDISDKVIMTGM